MQAQTCLRWYPDSRCRRNRSALGVGATMPRHPTRAACVDAPFSLGMSSAVSLYSSASLLGVFMHARPEEGRSNNRGLSSATARAPAHVRGEHADRGQHCRLHFMRCASQVRGRRGVCADVGACVEGVILRGHAHRTLLAVREERPTFSEAAV